VSTLDTTAEPPRPEGIRRLVINADDFGLSEGTNRGIVEAHRAGVVTAASLLVNTPGFEAAVRAARELPALTVGLHLNLTMGQPVSPPDAVPTLYDSRRKRLYPLVRFVGRALAGKIDGAEVARECTAQIERLRATGLRITHLDGHQHAHVLPGIWRSVVETARQAAVGPVRIPLEPAARIAWRPMAALGQTLLAASYRVASRSTAPPVRPSHFRGFALTGRGDFAARLLALLDSLQPGTTELMVHPGYPDADLTGWVGYAAGRERELAVLTSVAVRARLNRGDIELIGFAP
jgi:predicted glycoside hydrolase/deacetylase ChbG (UPF0249 family)